mgnify:CR=1 FL=1
MQHRCEVVPSGRLESSFALELGRHLGLEALEVADDLARLVGRLPVHVHPGQLVPRIRAHRLQFGIFLERLNGLVKSLQLNEYSL